MKKKLKTKQQNQNTDADDKKRIIIIIILIILLLLLLAIIVGLGNRGKTEEEELLESSSNVTDENMKKQTQEQLDMLVQSIIQEDEEAGRETTIETLTERLKKEGWISSTEPGENKILVTTTDGHIYNVYYDETTGYKGVENVGIVDKELANQGTTGEGSTGEGTTGGGSTGGGSTGGGSTGGGTSGEGTSGGGTSGEGSTGEGTSGEGSTGEGTSGEGSTGEGTSGEGSTGEGTSGQGSTGGGTSGGDSSGQGTSGGGTSGEGTTGGGSTGGDTTGGGSTGGDTTGGGTSGGDSSGEGTSGGGTSGEGTSGGGTSGGSTSGGGTSGGGTSGGSTSGGGTSGGGTSDKGSAPTIEISSVGGPQNGWYGRNGIPLNVTITATNPSATMLKYSIDGGTNWTTATDESGNNVTTKTIEIKKVGAANLIAYAIDEAGNESERATRDDIKYDNKAPIIGNIDIETINGEDGISPWKKADKIKITLPNITDEAEGSGVSGYYYWTVSKDHEIVHTTRTFKEVSEAIEITEDGATTIAFEAVDNAGNISNASMVTVYKDKTAPTNITATVDQSTIGTNEFTIKATAEDSASGILSYKFEVREGSSEGTIVAQSGENNTIPEYRATGLKAGTNYYIELTVTDKAGNTATTNTNKSTAAKVTLTQPTIEITANGTKLTETSGTWYKKGDTLTYTITAHEGEKIYYKLDGTESTYRYAETNTVTGTIEDTGTTTIKAYSVDTDGNKSEEATSVTVKYDGDIPTLGTIEVDGTQGTKPWYTKDAVKIKVNNVVDKEGGSGLKGIYYWKITDTSNPGAGESTKKEASENTITITEEGQLSYRIQVEDNAGNKEERDITIYKDSTAPTFSTSSPLKVNTDPENQTALKITANATDNTPGSGIDHYHFIVLDGDSIVYEEDSTTGQITVTGLDRTKTYTVVATAFNKAGLTKAVTGKGKLTGTLAIPKLTVPAATGSNNWHTSDVEVTVKDGAPDLANSEATQISYILDDGTETTKDLSNGEATITVSGDKVHTLKVRATDGNGNYSNYVESESIKIDKTAPNKAELGTPENVDYTTMDVQATGGDETSGVKKLTLQIYTSTDFTQDPFKNVEASVENLEAGEFSQKVKVDGLESGQTYYLKLKVTDDAGNETTMSDYITQKTKEDVDPEDAIASKIGSYVNYIPCGTDFFISKDLSGNNEDQTFPGPTSPENTKWRIWETDTENNKMTLIYEEDWDGPCIYLHGFQGYNNGVKLLNDACDTAYGSWKYGPGVIKGRCMNIEDLEPYIKVTSTESIEWLGIPDLSYPSIMYSEFFESLGRSKQELFYYRNKKVGLG